MVAVGGAVAAALAIADPLKPEARGVVAALAQRGLAVHLVTGDNWRALLLVQDVIVVQEAGMLPCLELRAAPSCTCAAQRCSASGPAAGGVQTRCVLVRVASNGASAMGPQMSCF